MKDYINLLLSLKKLFIMTKDTYGEATLSIGSSIMSSTGEVTCAQSAS